MRLILSLLYAPIIFFSLRYVDTPLDEMIILKAFPLALSSTITLMMILSYIQKKSIILYFAKKFSKQEIIKEEQEYIHKSTLFWIGVSFINLMIHFNILLSTQNSTFWAFYSSIGWYVLFGLAGVLQYLHRKFIFLKNMEN